jgi:hypothetical protein
MIYLLAQARLGAPDVCIRSHSGLSDDGYANVRWRNTSIGAHRFICHEFHGSPPADGMHAAHSCNVRNCINPHHIRWATPVENSADRLANGGDLRGTKSPRAQLIESEVIEIRRRHAAGERSANLAREFGISPATVGHIVRRESWAWLEEAS